MNKIRHLLSLILCVLLAQPAWALTGYKVPYGSTITIFEFSSCTDITNFSPSGRDLWVPTKTNSEWTAFTNNLPAGVTIATATYSPTCEGNLRLWLDANDETTLFQTSTCTTAATANGDPIGCWKDKSGLGFNQIQATAGVRPNLNTSQMNSKNVLLFNNTNKPLGGTFTATTSGLQMFIVANYTTTGGNDRAFFEISTGSGNRHFWIFQRYNSNTNFSPTAAVNSVLMVSHPAGTAFTAYQDSTVLQNGTAANGSANGTYGNLVIGDDSSGGNQLYGKIAEILVYQGTMTQTVRERVEGYLACKWGTQARLPGAHPYKSSCP